MTSDQDSPVTVADPLEGVAAEPGVAKPDPVITAHGVVRRFGGLVAVDVDHLEIQRGVITALIGPNGAGKTTLFNLLTGFDAADEGTRDYDGRVLDHRFDVRPSSEVVRYAMGAIGALTTWLLLGWVLARANDSTLYLVLGLVAAVVAFALAARNTDGFEATVTVAGGSAVGTLVGGLAAVLLSVSEGWVTVTMAGGWLVGTFAAIGLWRWATGPLPPHEVAQLGMVRTFQLTKALSKLTVMDNMRLGATDQRGEKFLPALFQVWHGQEAEITERADEILARFKLDHMRDEFAGTLSGGQRKLLEMARALMTEPEVVMLDEPMAGVNPALTQSLLRHITSLRDEGMSVVFVEHDMDVVQEISDWVVVMAEGRIIAEGPPKVVGRDQRVIDAYLGAHHDKSLEEIDAETLESEAEEELEQEEAELHEIEERERHGRE